MKSNPEVRDQMEGGRGQTEATECNYLVMLNSGQLEELIWALRKTSQVFQDSMNISLRQKKRLRRGRMLRAHPFLTYIFRDLLCTNRTSSPPPLP